MFILLKHCSWSLW